MSKLNLTVFLFLGALQFSLNTGWVHAEPSPKSAKTVAPVSVAEAKQFKVLGKPNGYSRKSRPKTFDSGAKLKSPYEGRKSMAEKAKAKKQDSPNKASRLAFESKLDAEADAAVDREKVKRNEAIKWAAKNGNKNDNQPRSSEPNNKSIPKKSTTPAK